MFVFVADPAGNYRWARSFSDGNDQWLSAAGDIAVAGNLYDAPGSKGRWTHRYGTPDWDNGQSVALDAAGHAALGGSFTAPVDFGNGTYTPKAEDMFLVRFAP